MSPFCLKVMRRQIGWHTYLLLTRADNTHSGDLK
jgi:hypothetical protein